MDILKPQLLWIGKRCYRVNSIANDNDYEQQKTATNEYVEDDLYGEENDEMEAQEEFDVVEVAPNRYKTTFHVPQAFYGAIIGSRGAVRKRIEGDTRTEITIPKHGTTGDIRILGTKRESVCMARRRIESIVINSRRKQRPTHFTCVRVIDTTIKNNVIKFKEEILKSGPTLGLQEHMFIEPHKLHITIGIMVLMDDVDRTRAVELLRECRESIVLPIKSECNDTKFTVRGVNSFNDDPSAVKYLYGKIESDALQRIGDGILNCFVDSGLAKREYDRDTVKLHMTLINANNRNDYDDDESKSQKYQARNFDARHILEKYADYEFGSQQFNEIHLAIMQSKDADGFYKCTASIQF
ncbi:activating signal cointegrator 1 complex subunit 1-like isoform X2 [Sitodiplosis mosellana]|nr:activating signal cointegrator 1 complex subunit 1-like isoform X2 [Sitodiplosis mosellana]